MTTTTTGISTAIRRSNWIGAWSNGSTEDGGGLYRYSVDLYRHPTGRYLLYTTGGAAMRTGEFAWLAGETDARGFLARYAHDAITGYGYTADEAAALLAGQNVRGSRVFEGRLPARPDLDDYRSGRSVTD